ncbi:MAG: anthranilate synthase component I family protein [Candidatus Cyclobacteriaceae bacterium M3_2C_046]
MSLKNFKFRVSSLKMLADTFTPVSIYLNLRDKFANSLLLESSDYHGTENSYSYICFDPISHFKVQQNHLKIEWPDRTWHKEDVSDKKAVLPLFKEYAASFQVPDNQYKFISSGLFGYMNYDAVEFFEDIEFNGQTDHGYEIPEIYYSIYRYIIAIDHFKNELTIFELNLEDQEITDNLDWISTLIKNRSYPTYEFALEGEETSNCSNEAYVEMVKNGIAHCHRGDVIQVVLSRRFQNKFKGDEFNVYRILRSINPSPYLFYFDYGSFKIFGSSPEAQIVIKQGEASIYPIAGTFRRTGNDKEDAALAKKLSDDPKENAEHVMLVDLARNDLSRNSHEVKVSTFKEVQYYSHVLHLVSKVSGQLTEDVSPVQLVADTFPAGTLSGAPKYKAMELINRYENMRRGYYGGAIGYMGFKGDFNHAIMIRSFLSKNNQLYYQAGAGIVAKSEPENELQEVNNKLAALRRALQLASKVKA